MNLFVAKLNPSTTSKDLQKLFAHYGLVTIVNVIFDRATGRSKCYGFVEMPDRDEALEAINELDNTLFQDSYILVRNSKSGDFRHSDSQSGNRNQRRSY